MARDFDGSTQYGSGTVAFTTSFCTLAAWINLDAVGDYHGIITAGTSPVWIILSGAVGNPLGFLWEGTADEYNAASGLTITPGTWYLVAVAVSATVATLYRGTQTSLSSFANTKTYTAKTVNTTWAVANEATNAGRFLNGRVANACVWSDTLNADEITGLCRGAAPETIRRSALQACWPLWGIQSPETDLSGRSRVLTLTGTPPAAAHAPVVPFSARYWQGTPQEAAAVVGAGLLAGLTLERRSLVR